MCTENSAHVYRVHTNNIVAVFCVNTGESGSVLRKHTTNSTSAICVLASNSASFQYANSSNIATSGKCGFKLCLVSSIRVSGLTELMNSTSKLRLYFNTIQTRKKYFKSNLEDLIYADRPVTLHIFWAKPKFKVVTVPGTKSYGGVDVWTHTFLTSVLRKSVCICCFHLPYTKILKKREH
jgi:hypothetical protein